MPTRSSVQSISLPGLVNPHDLASDRQFSMNLARGMEVLRSFRAADLLLSNRDITERTGLPKATVSRLTYTLTLLGYLEYDQASRKYRLGAGLLSLSYPLLAGLRVRHAARSIISSLAKATGCTVNLGMRDRACVVYIDSVCADTSNQRDPDIGAEVPLISTAIGRALILSRPKRERSAILNHIRLQDPEQFAQQQPFWDADEKLFAEQGYCHAQGGWLPHMHGIAVPVRADDGPATTAISCTIDLTQQSPDRLVRDVLPRLREAAADLVACG